MNAIVIAQSPKEIKLAFEVHQNAALSRIRLARAKAAAQSMDDGTKSPIAVVFNFRSKSIDGPARVLRLEIAFRMAGVEENEKGKTDAPGRKPDGKKPEPVVLVECAYEVDYALREGFSLTPEHVKAFKDGNAIFNTWPYFREYLQTNLQRMGLPPLTAPFLRLEPKQPRGREKDELEAPE